jgi:Membrane domain of glycerophosphoryl diester phosphodiesterase
MIEMSETFRPATLGEILDRTAQLYRRNFWLFAGVAALPIGAMFAISAVAVAVFATAAVAFHTTGLWNPATVGIAVFAALVAMPVYMATAVFSYAGLTLAAASAHRGEMMTIGGALGSVRPRFWSYLWFLILQGIVIALIPAGIAGVVIGILALLAMLAGGGTAISTSLGFLAFLVGVAAFGIVLWLALGYSLGLPVRVLEEKPAWQSLQRAWKLSQGTRGRIFVMILLVIALAIAASMLAAIPTLIIVAVITAIGNGAAYSTTALMVAEILRVVGDFALQVLLAPISSIAIVLFYYDQRVRKEGFDIEWMMQQAGLAQPVSAMPPTEGAHISGPIGPPDTPS